MPFLNSALPPLREVLDNENELSSYSDILAFKNELFSITNEQQIDFGANNGQNHHLQRQEQIEMNLKKANQGIAITSLNPQSPALMQNVRITNTPPQPQIHHSSIFSRQVIFTVSSLY